MILLVEDEPDQREMLTTALTARGYRVAAAANGREALELAKTCLADVVLLDLGLPDVDGADLCKHLRLQLRCPVVVVTADAEEDRLVDVLDVGADDYVLKPYRMNELLARVRVALRHRLATVALHETETLQSGDVLVDLGAHQLIVDGQPLDLHPRQFDLLVALMRNDGRTMTYAALARALWGLEAPDNYQFLLRSALSKLRKTLGVGPRRPAIDTQHHVGYRLTAPAE